jgi:hypothetical protein
MTGLLQPAARDSVPDIVSGRMALARLQANYTAQLDAETARILKRAGKDDDATARQVRDLLVMRRKRGPLHDLGTEDIAHAAAESPESLRALFRQENLFDHFLPHQKRLLAEASAARRETPAIRHAFGGEQRLYLSLPEDFVSAEQAAIAAYLQARGLALKDYAGGYAHDPARRQDLRIGKLLHQDPALADGTRRELLRLFENDPTRSKKLMVVITRDPTDLARVSTGRGWWSCLAADGSHWNYILRDIRRGSLAAYLVRDHDIDISDPLARLLIRPYAYAPGTWAALGQHLSGLFNRHAPREDAPRSFACGQAYGLSHPVFEKAADDFCAAHLNAGPDGTYLMEPGLANDTMPRRAAKKDGRLIAPGARRR